MVPKSVIRQLRRVVGRQNVLDAPGDVLTYEYDASTLFKAKPDVVVLPRSTEDVACIVKLCKQYGIPFLARGAGTGLSGGALATAGGVILELSRMNHILKINTQNRTALVEVGLVNLELSLQLAPFGFHFAPDPASQISCTIGGNVAENAGGPHCLKYGTTVNHILGLKVVLPDGEIVNLGGECLDAPGYDLVGVFVGSEGTLGIATEALVKIQRLPEAVETLLAVFDSMEVAGQAASGIIAAGIIPTAMEMIDRRTIEIIESSPTLRAGYPSIAAAVLVVELDGLREEVELSTRKVLAVFRDCGALETKRAQNEVERAQLWKGRKGAYGAMGRLAPSLYLFDVVVPRTKLPEVLRRITEIEQQMGLRIANFFHAGDGNLHPIIAFNRYNRQEVEQVLKAGEEILALAVAVGGTITGEHGVGMEKSDFMHLIFNDHDLDAMRKVKRVFDPRGLCNPGKIFPSKKSSEREGTKART